MENVLPLSQINETERNLVKAEDQKNFLETTLGKTINSGLDIGLRILLPDVIENQVIQIKDTILKEGFSEGIKKTIDSAIDLGKSIMGIFTGKFENVSQVQSVIKNGGILDGISNTLDFVLKQINKKTAIPTGLLQTVQKGKNVILNSISNHLEDEFTSELESAEKLQKYTKQWKNYYQEQNFEGMQREYEKIKEQLKNLVPLENTLKEARQIENIHQLIKNNGKNFNISKEQKELAEILV